MDSLRKSFKTYAHTSSRRPLDQEHQPILNSDSSDDAANGGEFVVKIDGNSPATSTATIWRDSSYDSSSDTGSVKEPLHLNFKSHRNAGTMSDDPPSQLIRKFLHKQKDSGSEIFLDMDFDMEDELQKQPPSKEVSFEQPTFKKPSSSSDSEGSSSGGAAADTAEVVRCTATSYRNSGLLRAKAKSRLMDPPPRCSSAVAEYKSGRVLF